MYPNLCALETSPVVLGVENTLLHIDTRVWERCERSALARAPPAQRTCSDWAAGEQRRRFRSREGASVFKTCSLVWGAGGQDFFWGQETSGFACMRLSVLLLKGIGTTQCPPFLSP